MFQLSLQFVKVLIAVSIFTGVFSISSKAQIFGSTAEEVEVPIIQRSGSKGYGCYMENGIIDEERLKRLIANRRCTGIYLPQNIDFAKQTLISYHAGGDCFLRVSAKVFRSDKAKKYTVRIRNTWGGCRAGGSVNGWMLIEKIPSDYTLSFVESKVDRYEKEELDKDNFTSFGLPQKNKSLPETLETRSIDLKGCIQTYRQKQYVIKDDTTYLKTIRNDASRDRCLKDVEKIDFSKHTLLGKEFNSGYCRIPLGLTTQAFKDAAKRQYILNISYIIPDGTCRHLSQYGIWVLVPKLPEDYEALFEVKPRFR